MRTFGHAFSSFFQKQDIWQMLAFSLLFRFGYGFLEKMGPLFMIGPREQGGLGLTNEVLGQINGIFGTGAFMVGSILGGLIVARYGLRKTLLLWLCLSLNVPNVVFVYLSMTQDARYPVVATLVTIDKLFWGIGAVGLIVYMMQQVSPGPFRTAYYTFASAIMGLNMMATGYVSGTLAELLGYKAFFWCVLACLIPSLVVTLIAPFHHPDATSEVPGRGVLLAPAREPADPAPRRGHREAMTLHALDVGIIVAYFAGHDPRRLLGLEARRQGPRLATSWAASRCPGTCSGSPTPPGCSTSPGRCGSSTSCSSTA